MYRCQIFDVLVEKLIEQKSNIDLQHKTSGFTLPQRSFNLICMNPHFSVLQSYCCEDIISRFPTMSDEGKRHHY